MDGPPLLFQLASFEPSLSCYCSKLLTYAYVSTYKILYLFPSLSSSSFSISRSFFDSIQTMRSSITLSANTSSLTSNLSTTKLHHRHYHHFHSFRRKTQTLDFRVPVLSTTSSSVSLNSRVWSKSSRLITVVCCCAGDASTTTSGGSESVSHGRSDAKVSCEGFVEGEDEGLISQVASPGVPIRLPPSRLSLSDQAFFLLAFIACTTSIAFTSLVVAAVPTLYAMGRAATSLAKLADTARDELPSTMAAIRLSGMEISDLTLELSDLSQEIADGVSKSAQAVQAAKAGIRQIGTRARQQTISIIQERASLPIISLQPVVVGAAKKTSNAVGRATRSFINIISRGEFGSKDKDNGSDKIEV